MDPIELSLKEMMEQLSFFIHIKDCMKTLDERIRGSAIFLAYQELMSRHREIVEWEVQDRPESSAIQGISGGETKVFAKVRTMSLHGRSGLGGRQNEALKRNLEGLSSCGAEYSYLFLLDPWTVDIVRDVFKSPEVTILPLLRENISAVLRAPGGDGRIPGMPSAETIPRMIEELITKDHGIPEDRIIVSPISRTSIRQGFLYIPKERGHLLSEGGIKIWIRKDASLDSKCMISATGGVRIGGGLTKWFRGMGLQANDELVMGSQEDGSLLVLMVRRAAPYRGEKPSVEKMKW